MSQDLDDDRRNMLVPRSDRYAEWRPNTSSVTLLTCDMEDVQKVRGSVHVDDDSAGVFKLPDLEAWSETLPSLASSLGKVCCALITGTAIVCYVASFVRRHRRSA